MQSEAGWIYEPTPPHSCILPSATERAKHLAGALWKCGECGTTYTLEFDSAKQNTHFVISAGTVVNA